MSDAGYVPCNGCTECCRNDAVRILPHEDASKWQTEPHPYMQGARMLAHKPNRDCIYLGEGGCTIHEDKPQICREMDCRRIAAVIPLAKATEFAASGILRIEVWRRGKVLMRGKEGK